MYIVFVMFCVYYELCFSCKSACVFVYKYDIIISCFTLCFSAILFR